MARKPENSEDGNAENEVLREARRHAEIAGAKARKEKSASRARVRSTDKEAGGKGLDWKAAAGLGIGSAALLAALLYSKSDKK